MVLGVPEGPGREATHPGDANFHGFGALGGRLQRGVLDKGYSILGAILQ